MQLGLVEEPPSPLPPTRPPAAPRGPSCAKLRPREGQGRLDGRCKWVDFWVTIVLRRVIHTWKQNEAI